MRYRAMRRSGMFLALPLLLLHAAFTHLHAQAQPTTQEEALRVRVAQLESRILQLESQIAALVSLLAEERRDAPAAAALPPRSAVQILTDTQGWQRTESWRRLRRGLTQLEVRYLLGEPRYVAVDRLATVWLYPSGARVQFGTETRRLEAWSEW